MGIAMALPSTILVVGWATMKLASEGYFSKTTGILIFLAIIGHSLITMVWYAFRNKDKS